MRNCLCNIFSPYCHWKRMSGKFVALCVSVLFITVNAQTFYNYARLPNGATYTNGRNPLGGTFHYGRLPSGATYSYGRTPFGGVYNTGTTAFGMKIEHR